ncbi:MAG: uroporphyrinogen decarboxylase family protein [Kiritimatiellae bacterium]|jgi:uroporphyrinogen decarboxylase|nr:uroporphyrinogen decarboxylase family protein [Kiritimatiellia bacterium]
MNSKERVLRSIQHQETDRIPSFFLGDNNVTFPLGKKLGVKADDFSYVTPGHMQLDEKLGCDVRFVWPGVKKNARDHRWFSCGDVHAAMHGEKMVIKKMPLEDASSVEDIIKYPHWPSPDTFDYEISSDLLPYLKDNAVAAYDMFILFLYAMGLRGMENYMMDMASNPDMAHAVMGKISAVNLERMRRFLATNQGLIDIAGIGDDVAGQNGMMFSVAMWREYIRPYLQKAVDLCREFSVIPYFHGCGGFTEIFDDMAAMGIQCVGRLQSEARGNEFSALKKNFGSRICLWGAIDGQHAVIEKNADEVREYVKNLMKIGAPGGGFVAGPTHAFTEDTPVENIIAVYETLRGEKIA